MGNFSILIGMGVGAGLLWVVWQSAPRQCEHRLNAALWALGGALLGGRAASVALLWPYYQAHPAEIPQVWLGGLDGAGALLGGVLGLLVAASVLRRPLGRLADALLPLLISVSVAAWLACWLDGTAYGPPVSAWWGVPARDEWGEIQRRLPVQLLGAMGTLLLSWLVERLRARLAHSGQAAALGLLGVALILFGLSFLRSDPSLLWGSLRPEAWGALILGGVALIGLLLAAILPEERSGMPF